MRRSGGCYLFVCIAFRLVFSVVMAESVTPSFRSKLEARVAAADSLLCVGLDPHIKDLFPHLNDADVHVPRVVTDAGGDNENDGNASSSQPAGEIPTEAEVADAAYTFCKTLIDATSPYAACYKPNVAFFEAIGPNHGMSALRRVVAAVPPDVPVLLDAKRGDIGTTASAYATASYGHLRADAITLSPLMGFDSVAPFVTGPYAGRGAFLLCKTSNPGSRDLLELPLQPSEGGERSMGGGDGGDAEALYERIAHLAGTDWAARCPPSSLLGLVVGATDPAALRTARARAGQDAWILAPGVGAQGGDLLEATLAGLNDHGTALLIPVSRGISRAKDPAAAAKALWEQIQAARSQVRRLKRDAPKATQSDELSLGRGEGSASDVGLEPHQREFLEFSLAQGVLKFGSFTLKSGRESPYFFNAGLFSTGAALSRLGKAYAATIAASSILTDSASRKPNFDVVFGPAYKGISLGAVVSAALYTEHGIDVGFAYNRKEAKDHGEGGTLVGASMQGKRVLIVDDVVTAGTAIREAHILLQSIGAHPMGVVIALDRAEVRSLEDRVSAVQAVARDLSLPVVSIASLPQLQLYLETTSNCDQDILKRVVAYRKDYGV